ncbi:MAG: hypothetical protein QXD23_03350 [Candidatus Micrarchaeaceae archaeon]
MVKISKDIINIFDKNQNGWFGLEFYICSGNRVLVIKNWNFIKHEKDLLILTGEISCDVTIKLKIFLLQSKNGCSITPIIKNNGDSKFIFEKYGFKIKENETGPIIKNCNLGIPVYMHTDNLRYEKLPHCRPIFPLIRPLPTEDLYIGDQPSGPIPVIFLGYGGDSNIWLMEGSLTQKRHLISWKIGLPNETNRMLEYKSIYTWTGGMPEFVNSHEEVDLETTIYKIIYSTPEKCYNFYMDELIKIYKFAGRKSQLNYKPVYCTWNYNIFTNIDEIDCLKRMDIVAKVQGKGFFQIDHGYQPLSLSEGQPTPEVDAYFPDGSKAWDLDRFPSGPQGFVYECKKRNLIPAIWWSPRVGKDGPIQKTKPEWLLRDKQGELISNVGHFLLDFSVSEVRNFIEMCLNLIVKQWKFEGIKLDFYSWMFDHPDLKFCNGGTGIFWKQRFINLIRSYLGPKGYFLHGVSCPMGNPFLANEFDSFRAGIDIHSGEWDYNVRNCSWLLPAIISTGKNIWYANIDSCMGKPNIPSNERRFRNSFAYITSGMLEFSGPIEKLDKEALDEYKILSQRCDQGTGVVCLDENAFYGRPLPKILIRYHSYKSQTYKNFQVIATIGFFNWTDTEQFMLIPFSKLNINKKQKALKFKNFWTGKSYHIDGEFIFVQISSRDCLLLDIF